MMILESIADEPSVDLLTRLTRQGPEDQFIEEATVTLQRMGKGGPAKTAAGP
jgi:hypothetical protein